VRHSRFKPPSQAIGLVIPLTFVKRCKFDPGGRNGIPISVRQGPSNLEMFAYFISHLRRHPPRRSVRFGPSVCPEVRFFRIASAVATLPQGFRAPEFWWFSRGLEVIKPRLNPDQIFFADVVE
jgi:hypothetical protein